MWKKIGIISLICSLGLCLFTYYHVKNAENIHSILYENAQLEPWVFHYLNVVEDLHLKKSEWQYKSTIKKWNEDLPFLENTLKKLGISSGLISLEQHLLSLSKKYDFIPKSFVKYPANSWLYSFVDNPNEIDKTQLPGLIFFAIYKLSPNSYEYSIETYDDFTLGQLKEAFEYRNIVMLGCESYDFIDWKTIDGETTCAHVQKTLMEPQWERWFSRSEHKHNFLPRLIGNYAHLSTLKHASLEVCNFSPYTTKSAIQYAAENNRVKVLGWYHHDIGECHSFNEIFIDTEPEFWVHISSTDKNKFKRVTDAINKIILSDNNSNNDNLTLKLADDSDNLWNDAWQCVSNDAFDFQSNISGDKKCQGKLSDKITFAKAMPTGKENNSWYFFAEHPNLVMFRPDKEITDIAAKNDASQRVKNLALAVSRQEEFERIWRADQVPFSLGATAYDYNGSLMPGVMLQGIASLSIGGAPLPYQNGDILLSLNGKTIYGISDLYSELINHGYSLSAGYKKPLKVALERDGQLKTYQTTYFFNKNHSQFFDVSEDEATAWGIGDAVTFGTSEITKCVGTNLAIFTGNTISGAFEVLDSFFENRKFRKEELHEFEYIDVQKCKWEAEQRKAIAQQRHISNYIDSQWFAIATPSAVRLLGQRFFRNYARKKLARGVLGIAIADGMLEGVETGLWSIGTAAPELTLEARVQDAGKIAPYGIGLGFISGLVFSKI